MGDSGEESEEKEKWVLRSGPRTETIPKHLFQRNLTENTSAIFIAGLETPGKCSRAGSTARGSAAALRAGWSGYLAQGKGTSIPSRGGPVPAPSAPGMPSQYLQLYPQPGGKKIVKARFYPIFSSRSPPAIPIFILWTGSEQSKYTFRQGGGIKNHFMQSLIN